MEAGLSCSSCNLVLMLQMHKNQIQDWNLKLKIVIDLAQSSYLFSNHSCILEGFFRLKSGKNVKGKPTTFPQNISFSCSFLSPVFLAVSSGNIRVCWEFSYTTLCRSARKKIFGAEKGSEEVTGSQYVVAAVKREGELFGSIEFSKQERLISYSNFVDIKDFIAKKCWNATFYDSSFVLYLSIEKTFLLVLSVEPTNKIMDIISCPW